MLLHALTTHLSQKLQIRAWQYCLGHFFCLVVRKGSLSLKVPIFETKKMALRVAKSKIEDHCYSSNFPQIWSLRLIISWISHFRAQFWPYFNFADFQAYFGHFSLVKYGRNGQASGQNLPISSWPNFIFKVMGQFYT